MTSQTPREIDEKLADLHDQAARISRDIDATIASLHRAVGDKKRYVGRSARWSMTLADVLAQARERVASGLDNDLSIGHGRIARYLFEVDELAAQHSYLLTQISGLDEIYRADPWSRFFPCGNADGHIHSSLRGCSTVRWDTEMGWYPQLSGKTVGEAVQELGPTLCSVCFPAAPVEWRRTRSEVNAGARAAEKAQREAAKAIKNLAADESFRSHRGDRVETVAAAKQVLRDEVELRDYYGRGMHTWHPASVVAAKTAAEVLLAREERQAGTGATQAEVDRIIASAVKKARKEGARI